MDPITIFLYSRVLIMAAAIAASSLKLSPFWDWGVPIEKGICIMLLGLSIPLRACIV